MNIDNLDDFNPNLTPDELRSLATRFRGSLEKIEIEIWECQKSEKIIREHLLSNPENGDEYWRKMYNLREKIAVFEFSSRKYSDALRFVHELAEEIGVMIDEPPFVKYFRLFLYYCNPRAQTPEQIRNGHFGLFDFMMCAYFIFFYFFI